VLLPFDAGEAFGFDKAAGTPCRHLAGHACTIHAGLAAAGFAGCLRYDCLGAGQRVVQEVFSGKSWRDDAGLLAPMEAAFRAMRRLHEDHAMLVSAARLTLLEAEEAERQRLITQLNIGQTASAAGLAAFEAGPLPRAVKDFTASLKARLRPRR
jgi:hypothetical protein